MTVKAYPTVCVLVGVLALTSARSTGPQGPTVMETPRIVWDDNIGLWSDLEEEPVVQKARAAEIGLAMATNTGDFTIAQLTDNVTRELIDIRADNYGVGDGDDLVLYPGPNPWLPLRIIKDTAEEAVIEICHLESTSPYALRPHPWTASSALGGEPGGKYDREDAQLYHLRLVEEDGELKMPPEAYGRALGECDGSKVPVGRFLPPPTFPELPVDGPARWPLWHTEDD